MPACLGLAGTEGLGGGQQVDSVAATGSDHHVAVLAQDDVVAAVIVEHRGGTQLGRGAARLGDHVWLHQVHQGLQDGMVGGIHAGVQWKGALPLTVVSRVALRGDDPVQPAKVLEADVELMPSANLPTTGTRATTICWDMSGVLVGSGQGAL